MAKEAAESVAAERKMHDSFGGIPQKNDCAQLGWNPTRGSEFRPQRQDLAIVEIFDKTPQMIDQWLHDLESDTLCSKAFGVNILPGIFSLFGQGILL